jgi:hypothetical protein
MSSFRIKVLLNNKSFTSGPDIATGQGATVIPAARGPMKPVKINRGETERVRQLFSADRYEVLEAIAYNNKYPLWISAPASGGANAAVLMTDTGLLPVPIVLGGDPADLDMSGLWMQFAGGVSDGEARAYNLAFPKSLMPPPPVPGEAPFIPRAMIVVGDEPRDAALTWDDAISGYRVSVPNLGSGTVTGPAGAGSESYIIQWVFDAGSVPPKGVKFAARFTTDVTRLSSKVYALFGMRFPCADYAAVSVYKADNEGNLILNLCYKKKGVYYQQSGYPVEFSLARGTVNGSGANIYIEEVLKFDDFIFGIPAPGNQFDWDTWTGGSDGLTDFAGGDRRVPCAGQMLVEGWEQFKEFKKYPADIYFDVTADPLIPAEFSALRASAAPYRRFLYPYPATIRPGEITSPPNVQNRGLCAFWGSAYIMNPYEPTGNLLSTLMGEVASRYADARVFSFGGRAVAWGDENQVGGQLNQGRIVNFFYDAKEDEMRQLDKYRINPIVLNELFGPMVASRRTTDTGDTDYSYSDYSMLTDYVIERIINEVLPYQLIKFNDDNHRAVVRAKAELILKPMTQAPNNVIRDYAIKCDSENNGDDVLTRQEFVLTVAIKVTPKSEQICFNFINSAQGGSVEEDVK